VKRDYFENEEEQTFIPIKKGMNPKRQEREEDWQRKAKKQPQRRDRRNYDSLENEGWR
jgi:hypothetical protein